MSKLKGNPRATKRKYSRLTGYILRQWPNLTVILGLTAIGSVVRALNPWPLKLLVDYALKNEMPLQWLDSLLRGLSAPTPEALIALAALGSFGLFAINSGLGIGLTWAWTVAGQRMVYHLSTDLFHRLQRLSLLFHSRRSVGDSLSRLTGDTWCVYTLTGAFFSPVEQVFTLSTIGLVAWHLNSELAIISLLTAPALAVSTLYFGRCLKRRAKMGREASSSLLSFVHQTLAAIPIVQAFTSESRNSRRFEQLAGEVVAQSQRGILLNCTYGLVNGLITTLGAAVILFLGGRQVLSGRLSLGSLIVFLAYMRTLQDAAEGLLKTYGTLKPVEASIERVLEILDGDDGEVPEAPNARALVVDSSRARVQVCLEGVTFGYEPGRPVLKGINLEVRPGETLALVGSAGAGKTTLVSLIPRFFDPWKGRVLFDGIDVRDLTVASLRAQISIVLQEPFLFPATVADNIAYGRLEASRDEIVAAAKAANLDGLIRQLPRGYDTVLGERGATLSGGERQRLAIARALLKDAPVLILDEPTAALDANTELLLLEALERLMQGRTTFIIAHRLSTIRRADRIVVLEGGEIAEAGTHQDLLANRGSYHRLHSLQFQAAHREGVA